MSALLKSRVLCHVLASLLKGSQHLALMPRLEATGPDCCQARLFLAQGAVGQDQETGPLLLQQPPDHDDVGHQGLAGGGGRAHDQVPAHAPLAHPGHREGLGLRSQSGRELGSGLLLGFGHAACCMPGVLDRHVVWHPAMGAALRGGDTGSRTDLWPPGRPVRPGPQQ